MRKYKVTVKFLSGNEVVYPGMDARNKEAAKLRVKLDRQRRGDEMFIRSIKVETVK